MADTTAAIDAPLSRFAGAFCARWSAVAGLVVIVATMLVALFAAWITPQNPYDLMQLDIMDGQLAPGSVGGAGYTHWLGTDIQGRDMVSAIVYGLRISLIVGVTSVAIAVLVGLSVGLSAAYVGGRYAAVMMRVVDIQLSFPAILIALVLVATLGRGIDKVIIALVAVQWAYYARTVRGAALVERQKDYIAAATCLGLSHGRILVGHLLPNCLPPLMVVATVQVANAIALEATLSFLGVGVPVTEPSLGMLIANGYEFMLSGRYWISVYPGVALLLVILAINLVGDQMREVLNPRLDR